MKLISIRNDLILGKIHILCICTLSVILSLFILYGAVEGKEDFSECELSNLEGYHLIQEGSYEKAIPYLEKAIDNNPDFAVAYNNLGSAYYNLGEYDKAIGKFKEAIELEREYVRPYFNLASCHFWKGEYIQVFRYLRKAQEIDEEYTESRLDVDKTIEEVEKQLEEDPKDENLKEIYNRLLELK